VRRLHRRRFILFPLIKLEDKLCRSIHAGRCILFSTRDGAFSAFKSVVAGFKSRRATARFSGTIVLFYGIVGLFRLTQQ
jgi:hypothetical protein